MIMLKGELDRHISDARRERSGHRRPLKIAAALLALSVAGFAVVLWPQTTSDAAHASATASGTEADTQNAVFDYFPAQFETPKKNSAPEEHIQAF